MTIDLSTCDKPQIRNGFTSIVKAAAIMQEQNPNRFKDSLNEIETCFEKAKSSDSEEPHWADVLVDIVLAFLPESGGKSTPLFVNGITTLASHVTPDVVDSLRAALTSTSDDDEDEMDESDDEEEGEETPDAKEGADGSSDDEEMDDSEDEVGDEEEETELDQFKQKLQTILCKDVPEDEEDEQVLGDDAMEGLDEALADAFRERVGGKKAERLSKKEQQDFRCRVLSVYAAILHKREVEVELVVPLIPVLLSFLRTHDVSAGSVAAKVLTIIARIKKLRHIQKSVQVEGLLQAIESCFLMTTRNMPTPNQTGVAVLISWLLKVSKNSDNTSEVDALVRKLAKESIDRKTTNKTFFTDLSRSSEAVAFALIESRAEIAFDPSVKKQKRALETEIIANALLTTRIIPDSLFDSLWQKVTAAVADMVVEEKPVPELLNSSLKVMSHLKRSKQGEFKEVDQSTLDKLANLNSKTRKKMHKSGQKALKTFVKYDGQRRAQDSENARRRRDNPYLNKKNKQNMTIISPDETNEQQKPKMSETNGKHKKSPATFGKRHNAAPAFHGQKKAKKER